MRAARLAGLVVLGLWLVAGCRAKNPSMGTPPPGPIEAARTQAQSLRDTYLAVDPNARVGVVLAVRPNYNLAAVGDIPVQDFAIGDTVSFINAAQQGQTLAHGTVTEIDSSANLLVVKYEIAGAGGRPPQEGDLAVRFRQ